MCPGSARPRHAAPVPAPQKLTYADVKLIRRRARRGARITDLAAEYGVDRKTVRRRLDAHAQAEAAEAQPRLRRQAAAERRKLAEREQRAAAPAAVQDRWIGGREMTYSDWLARPKSLTGRALSEANGLVRLRSPDGRICGWRERHQVDELLDVGWTLA
jgi:hypothetical protein